MVKQGKCDNCGREGNLIEYNGEYLAYAALKLNIGECFCESCRDYFSECFWKHIKHIKSEDLNNYITNLFLSQ